MIYQPINITFLPINAKCIRSNFALIKKAATKRKGKIDDAQMQKNPF
jgi:hypothetical protein